MVQEIMQQRIVLDAAITAAYFGAEVLYKPSLGDGCIVDSYTLSSTAINFWVTTIDRESVGHYGGFNDCYLMLVPILKIMDEDAINVAKIVLARHNRHYKEHELFYSVTLRNSAAVEVTLSQQSQQIPKPLKLELVTIRIERDAVVTKSCESDSYRRGEVYHTPDQYSATDYLRASIWNGVKKQSYDCGYGPIRSLIDAGAAFDKTIFGKGE